ncbi:MAG: hypothetical protein OXE57_14815 [Alphaproteobacteria bacterium]|nr:hypothetical protein [Alphaproteobacteria bacterium]
MTVFKAFLGAHTERLAFRRDGDVAMLDAEVIRSDNSPTDDTGPNMWDFKLNTFNAIEHNDLVTFDRRVFRVIYVRSIRIGPPSEPLLTTAYLVEAPDLTPDQVRGGMVFDPRDFDSRDFA